MHRRQSRHREERRGNLQGGLAIGMLAESQHGSLVDDITMHLSVCTQAEQPLPVIRLGPGAARHPEFPREADG